MKLVSWNVNGIRAAEKKGFLQWFMDQNADVVCLQEIKANPEQLNQHLVKPRKYFSYWLPAQKAGYSGVALFSKKEPEKIRFGFGKKEFDREGRLLIAEYSSFVLMNAYFPNSQRDHSRLGFKLKFCDSILRLCEQYRKKGMNLVLCGDYNIAHKAIDLKNPKPNENNAGFLPQERAWMDKFTKKGYVDAFRIFEKGPGHYTWWSYRPGVRQRNIGWRIDYFSVNPEFKDRVETANHQTHVMGSDHCPIDMKIKN